MYVTPQPTAEELAFAAQLGVECVFTRVEGQGHSAGALKALKSRVEDHGLTLYNVGSGEYGKNHQIHLALTERDQMIKRCQEFVGNLGQAGIGVTTFTWEPDKVWSTHRMGESRGAPAR